MSQVWRSASVWLINKNKQKVQSLGFCRVGVTWICGNMLLAKKSDLKTFLFWSTQRWATGRQTLPRSWTRQRVSCVSFCKFRHAVPPCLNFFSLPNLNLFEKTAKLPDWDLTATSRNCCNNQITCCWVKKTFINCRHAGQPRACKPTQSLRSCCLKVATLD